MEQSITTTSIEHSETFDVVPTNGNAYVAHSPNRQSDCVSSSNLNSMKYEQISSESPDQIQPIIIIDTNSTSHISSSTAATTNESNATVVPGQSSSTLATTSDQSQLETDNDTFDAGPSSLTQDISDLDTVAKIDTEIECSSYGDVNDAIKILQSRHVRDELDLFCYVCNYGFKSFPRLIRHMETKKHANQVEKYHAINAKHCFNATGGTVTGCDHYHRHAYPQQRPAPPTMLLPPQPPQPSQPPLILMQPQQQLLFPRQQHHFEHPAYHHQQQQQQQLFHYHQQSSTTSSAIHSEMELLPEDVFNQMINSLGDDILSNSDAFNEFDTTDLNEILDYLQ